MRVRRKNRSAAAAKHRLNVVELVALRRVAPRSAAQPVHETARFATPVPPALRAGLSQRDNRYH